MSEIPVSQILDRYPAERTSSLAVLQDIQREYKHLPRAALELGVGPDVLQAAIRGYGQANPVPAGVAMLAGGGRCSRDLFAQQFSFLDKVLKQ